MSDLIERQAAIDLIKKCIPPEECAKQLLIMGMEQLPSAQPEIVRCKDCLMHGVCQFELGLGENGFCSQAERRTDE